MDTKTPQPDQPKQRPVRFATIDAFADAYHRLHGHASVEPEKSAPAPAGTSLAP